MKSSDVVIFVYSDMQLSNDKNVVKSIGKTVVPGTVAVGSTREAFTKMIREDYLTQMVALYPDTKQILKCKYSDAVFTDVTQIKLTGDNL